MNMLFPDCCQLASEQTRSSAWAFYAAIWSNFIITLLTGFTEGILMTALMNQYNANMEKTYTDECSIL